MSRRAPSERGVGRKRGVYLAVVIVAWLGAIFLLAVTVVSVAHLIGGSDSKQSGGVGPAILAIVALGLLTGGATRVGVVAEHRFREMSAAGSTSAGALLHPPSPSAQRSGVLARHPRHPISAVLGGLVVVGVLVWCPTQTVVNFLSWERSQSTQRHGIAASAILLHVTNTKHCNRGGCYYTAAAPAELIPPVHGRARTTVHGEGQFSGDAGSRAQILVDPHELGYAEFPGDPLLVVADWAIFLGLWIFLWGGTIWTVLQTPGRRQRPQAVAGMTD